eukprot:tig00020554_g10853.t1
MRERAVVVGALAAAAAAVIGAGFIAARVARRRRAYARGAACAAQDSLDDRESVKEGAIDSDEFRRGLEQGLREQRKRELEGVSSQDLLCPVSRALLVDPVVAPCKHRFNRKSIMNWLTRASVCPVCRSALLGSSLRADLELARVARLWAEEHPEAEVDEEGEAVRIEECFEIAPQLVVTREQHAAIERALSDFTAAHAGPGALEEEEPAAAAAAPQAGEAQAGAAGPAGPTSGASGGEGAEGGGEGPRILHPNPEEDLRIRLARAVGPQIAAAYIDSLSRQVEYEMRLATKSDMRALPAFLASPDYQNQLFFAEECFGLRGIASATPSRVLRMRQHTIVVFGPTFPLHFGPPEGEGEGGLWDAAFIGPHRCTTFDRVPQFSVWATGPLLASVPSCGPPAAPPPDSGSDPEGALPPVVCMFVRDVGEGLNPMRVFRRADGREGYVRITVAINS